MCSAAHGLLAFRIHIRRTTLCHCDRMCHSVIAAAQCCAQILMPKHADSLEAVCAAAARIAQDQDASVVMLVTETGEAPRMTAKYRPRVPIVACCPNEVRHSGRDNRPIVCYGVHLCGIVHHVFVALLNSGGFGARLSRGSAPCCAA